MVSGIGPKQELAKQNITVISDRPGVGQNMRDHILFPVTHQINVETTSILEMPAQANAASRSYLVSKTGILTTNGTDYLGWEKVPQYYANLCSAAKRDLSAFPVDWPDLEYVVLSFNPGTYVQVNIAYGRSNQHS
jgi:choline dehydrogenase